MYRVRDAERKMALKEGSIRCTPSKSRVLSFSESGRQDWSPVLQPVTWGRHAFKRSYMVLYRWLNPVDLLDGHAIPAALYILVHSNPSNRMCAGLQISLFLLFFFSPAADRKANQGWLDCRAPGLRPRTPSRTAGVEDAIGLDIVGFGPTLVAWPIRSSMWLCRRLAI
jgi:hypothetical protein